MPSFEKWSDTVSKGLEYNSTTGQASGMSNVTIIFLVIGLVLILIALVWLIGIWKKKKRGTENNNKNEPQDKS